MSRHFCYHPACRGRGPFSSRARLTTHQKLPHGGGGRRFNRAPPTLRPPKTLDWLFTLSVDAGLPIGNNGMLKSIAEVLLRRRIDFGWWHDDDLLHDLRIQVAKREAQP